MSGRDMGHKRRRGGGEAPSGQHSWLSEVENPRPPTTFVFRVSSTNMADFPFPPPGWGWGIKAKKMDGKVMFGTIRENS